MREMRKREVVIEALEFRPPPYVPWAWSMTPGCADRMKQHLDVDDLSDFVGSHFLWLYSPVGRMKNIDSNHCRDVYGVVWDRTVDKDIGVPSSRARAAATCSRPVTTFPVTSRLRIWSPSLMK